MHIETTHKRSFIGRFEHNDDLHEKLTDFCVKNNIKTGTLNVIGAVLNAKLGYYNQKEKKYSGCVEFDRKMEIASCMGNISLNNGAIFVHAHIVLADYNGQAFGGHLMPGTKIFAAEFFIQELECGLLTRVPDADTGLPLWSK